MIFKVIFYIGKKKSEIKSIDTYEGKDVCKVISVENGPRLEQRIDAIISNYKCDGYDIVELRDCRNISNPDPYD